ncbi:MAG: hypothetical protein SFV17_13380 [Candidatus Obscuribacter sp.]|nr:hypothetical protein [Candidatus Melainabacteria bacterium]MDX1987674.1 hypothetical protein [Candidatus Obscuribacter sp.]
MSSQAGLIVVSGRRSCRGSLSVELASGSFLMVVFVLLSLHLGIIIFGAYLNDRVCRDACRNAAQGKDIGESTRLANAVVKGYSSSSFLDAPQIAAPLVYQDFAGSPPSQTSPYVSVTTTTKATMPFGVLAFFDAGILQDGKLTFRKTYTFPIVRIK